jgi:hypothetical protein
LDESIATASIIDDNEPTIEHEDNSDDDAATDEASNEYTNQ